MNHRIELMDRAWKSSRVWATAWSLLLPGLLALGCVNLDRPASVSGCAGSSTNPCTDNQSKPNADAPVAPPNLDAPIVPSPDVPGGNDDVQINPLGDDAPVDNFDSPVAPDDGPPNGDVNIQKDTVPDGKGPPDLGPDILIGTPEAGPEVQPDAQSDLRIDLPPDLGREVTPEPGPEPAGVESGLEPGLEPRPEVGPEPGPEPGLDGGSGDTAAANCVQQIINNGYSFGTIPPCSVCVENQTSRAKQCADIIDCLQVHYPCTGNCTNTCNNAAQASSIAIGCAYALTTAANCPPP